MLVTLCYRSGIAQVPGAQRMMTGTIKGRLKIYLLMKYKEIGRQQLYLRRKHIREDVMQYKTYWSAQMSQIKSFWLKAHNQLKPHKFKQMKRSFVLPNLKLRQMNIARFDIVAIFKCGLDIYISQSSRSTNYIFWKGHCTSIFLAMSPSPTLQPE